MATRQLPKTRAVWAGAAIAFVQLTLGTAVEADAQSGPQTWNILLGQTVNVGGVANPIPVVSIPVIVSTTGTFSAPQFDLPTVAAGPCTVQAKASIPSGLFDTAIHLTLRLIITSVPPSDPSCPNTPPLDIRSSPAPLDRPFPNATTTTSPGTLSTQIGGVTVSGTFTASCLAGCGQPAPATVTAMTGSVQATLGGDPVRLGVGLPIVKDMSVATGVGGEITGTCASGSQFSGNQFTLGPNSSLFLEDSFCQQASSGMVDLTQGQFNLAAAPAASSAARALAAFSPLATGVRTPVSQTVVRSGGTAFSTIYSQTATTGTAVTTVTTGAVDVTDSTTGAVNTLTAGQPAFTVFGPLPRVVAAVLPSSRSVQVPTAATAFGTIVNGDQQKAALVCQISPITSVPGATFSFQTTNPATNQLVGLKGTPVSIAAGAFQPFVIAVTPTLPFGPTDVQFNFACAGAQAPIIVGLNTLLFSAADTPVPDIVALAATVDNDGRVKIPGPTGTGFFAVATVNVGASGTITVSADTGTVALPITVSLCQTNTAGGCLNPAGPTVTTTIPAGAQLSFAVFVTGSGTVPFDPGNNRIFVRFKEGSVTRGSTSVSVETKQ